MNVISFIDLMRSIYAKKLPDLDKIQDKGLLAVKIAQHFALRVDFLDPDVCRHLAKLYTQARPIEGVSVYDLLSRHVDKAWIENFASIDDIPLATASIGQVHKAILKNGNEVVIKIIKSDFEKSFLKDLRSLRMLLKLCVLFYPKLRKVFDPLSILKHIEDYTLSELKLSNEISGRNQLEEIAKKYSINYDLTKLKLPRFYDDLSNENVLVSDYIAGTTFDNALNNGMLNYSELLTLFKIHGLFIFGEGHFHGDLHPGNIILDGSGFIHFLDTGALSKSTKQMSHGLFHFFVALTEYNYHECCSALNNMSLKKLTGKHFNLFLAKFCILYKDFKGKTISKVSLTKKMMDTIKLAVHSGMEFDKGMFPIIKSLMYLDGMVLRCNPNANLIEDMKPLISKFKEIIDEK
jgi:ubiquinone biosynthesis protein